MNRFLPAAWGAWPVRYPQVVLVGHLLILHVLAFGGWQGQAARLLWPVAFGLMLIWQPFVEGERRVGWGQALALVALALGSVFVLNPWLLLVWCGVLAAVIGGRVLWTVRAKERVGYLFAFGYLVSLILFGVVPEIAPGSVVLDPLPAGFLARYLPFLLLFLLFFPARQPQRRAGDAFDLLSGMLVFLLLAALVLGSLAFMQIDRAGYLEAVFKTSISLALALLILAWAWNPRGGFSGIGSAFARYVLSVGMPLEQWLQALNEESEREPEPAAFMAAALKRLAPLPWVAGGAWQHGAVSGEFGQHSAWEHHFRREDLHISLYFSHGLSPSMRWHFEWLLRLLAEYYLVKRQAAELQRVGYLQAVYETGSRVTHDVKNLLQSLQALCFASSQNADPVAKAELLSRQLPLIADRLKATLDKLQKPAFSPVGWQPAGLWWKSLQERYAGAEIDWREEACPEPDVMLPSEVFDSVAENLLQNALAKRQREPGLRIVASIAMRQGAAALIVQDNGRPIEARLAGRLCRETVVSEDGLGIGLYHAAQLAEGAGYELALEENGNGKVGFSLSARS